MLYDIMMNVNSKKASFRQNIFKDEACEFLYNKSGFTEMHLMLRDSILYNGSRAYMEVYSADLCFGSRF